eukprot:CAMPEP_0174364548 /NCGR_PEP_ID=MMETSP0811_2-20130205/73400_1 /TAXON_ID=73025 ORGANISM="Eutreptiella gymnastica-like, Strain CCMP1594" /NCGR_SAMPLE_ID=MMETSP0811_2 /ASSEMBLY_ACC=CAM_ASM_000667 /LENGTH=98 /DNA_ID=CAMNT_0015504299 /DNA_START=23 /DNA_END=319 /DNA_ORIENTATION=+
MNKWCPTFRTRSDTACSVEEFDGGHLMRPDDVANTARGPPAWPGGAPGPRDRGEVKRAVLEAARRGGPQHSLDVGYSLTNSHTRPKRRGVVAHAKGAI